MPLLFAQSLVEYSSLSESLSAALTNLWNGLRDVDQNIWIGIAGVLVVLAYFTRRSGRR